MLHNKKGNKIQAKNKKMCKFKKNKFMCINRKMSHKIKMFNIMLIMSRFLAKK